MKCVLCKRSKTLLKNIPLFSFPKHPTQRVSWQKFCNLHLEKSCQSLYICGLHFIAKDYVEPNAQVIGTSMRLKPQAVPCIRNTTGVEIKDGAFIPAENTETKCTDEHSADEGGDHTADEDEIPEYNNRNQTDQVIEAIQSINEDLLSEERKIYYINEIMEAHQQILHNDDPTKETLSKEDDISNSSKNSSPRTSKGSRKIVKKYIADLENEDFASVKRTEKILKMVKHLDTLKTKRITFLIRKKKKLKMDLLNLAQEIQDIGNVGQDVSEFIHVEIEDIANIGEPVSETQDVQDISNVRENVSEVNNMVE